MRALVLALGAILLLSGCASGGVAAYAAKAVLTAESPEAAQETIRADLEEALRSATVHEDKRAVVCWTEILSKLDGLQGQYLTEVKGAASAHQKARNIRRKFTEGISEDIAIACAAMKNDSRSALLGFAKLVGIPVP